MAGAEAPYAPEEPSPWWLKGLAIFMALVVMFMLFNTAMGILSPMLVDEFMPEDFYDNRPWGKGNNPYTAAQEFLKSNPGFEIDQQIEDKLMITSSPGGYIKKL